MEKQMLYTSNSCTIEHIAGSDFIIIRWFGFPKSDAFREACNTTLNYMLELGVKKLLTDNRQAKVFSVSDQKWLNEDWFPRALALGYHASATLISEDVFVKTAINKIIQNRKDTKVLNKSFTNENEALEWLNSI